MEHKINNICQDREFFGRDGEIEYVCARATEDSEIPCKIYLLGKKWSGKTEISRRVYLKLFQEQERVVPLYYQFNVFHSALDFAEDFLKETIKQYLAFFKREPDIATEKYSLDALKNLLIDTDFEYLTSTISKHMEYKIHDDVVAVLRNALGTPGALSRHTGTPAFLILDDLDIADPTTTQRTVSNILKECEDNLFPGNVRFLASGTKTTFQKAGGFNGQMEILKLKGLKEVTAVDMMNEMCSAYGVDFESDTLTVAARHLEGIPLYIKSIIGAAKRGGQRLKTLKDWVDLYVDEVTEGNLAFLLRGALSLKDTIQLKILHALANTSKGVFEREIIEKFGGSSSEINIALIDLGASDLLDTNCGTIKWTGDNVTKDFVNYIYAIKVNGTGVDEAKTELASTRLKEDFKNQGKALQGNFKKKVIDLLKRFNGQRIPATLLCSDDKDNKMEGEEMSLPLIVGCFDITNWEGMKTNVPITLVRGFHNTTYDESNEVLWLVWIKEAMVPADRADAENFQKSVNFLTEKLKKTSVVKLMVSREGFEKEALNFLSSEDILSTDSVRLHTLETIIEDIDTLEADVIEGISSPGNEFEMVLSETNKAELLAATMVEGIAREMGFNEESVSQIKTALIEGCINAFEHSGVKRCRVHLRVVDRNDRLIIHIENPGRMFAQPLVTRRTGSKIMRPALDKRGQGIKIMKGLMDTVNFEKLFGGTKLTIIKYLKRNGEYKVENKSAEI